MRTGKIVSFMLKSKLRAGLTIRDMQRAECSRINKDNRKSFSSCTSSLLLFFSQTDSTNVAANLGSADMKNSTFLPEWDVFCSFVIVVFVIVE